MPERIKPLSDGIDNVKPVSAASADTGLRSLSL
uniref:Uncharacterized protein n=1 Tax=Neisseria meningitidis alpha275 TaxID=295996 RepID=C6SKR9_NEIME|nr:hypothetical protein predicted by Glimmer/Critica [Neisseria meningitidis alpha275]